MRKKIHHEYGEINIIFFPFIYLNLFNRYTKSALESIIFLSKSQRHREINFIRLNWISKDANRANFIYVNLQKKSTQFFTIDTGDVRIYIIAILIVILL